MTAAVMLQPPVINAEMSLERLESPVLIIATSVGFRSLDCILAGLVSTWDKYTIVSDDLRGTRSGSSSMHNRDPLTNKRISNSFITVPWK